MSWRNQLKAGTLSVGVAVLVLLASASDAVADGYKMKDGRYASGPVTVLRLSALQKRTARTSRIVVLDESQRKLLKREGGKGPTVLHIQSLKIAGKDCTCGQYNLAVWFAADAIEVPHSYLATDEAAAEIKDDEDAGRGEA